MLGHSFLYPVAVQDLEKSNQVFSGDTLPSGLFYQVVPQKREKVLINLVIFHARWNVEFIDALASLPEKVVGSEIRYTSSPNFTSFWMEMDPDGVEEELIFLIDTVFFAWGDSFSEGERLAYQAVYRPTNAMLLFSGEFNLPKIRLEDLDKQLQELTPVGKPKEELSLKIEERKQDKVVLELIYPLEPLVGTPEQVTLTQVHNLFLGSAAYYHFWWFTKSLSFPFETSMDFTTDKGVPQFKLSFESKKMGTLKDDLFRFLFTIQILKENGISQAFLRSVKRHVETSLGQPIPIHYPITLTNRFLNNAFSQQACQAHCILPEKVEHREKIIESLLKTFLKGELSYEALDAVED